MDFSREEPNLPSDSDESDEDYVPSGAESNPPSEVESDGEEEEDAPDDDDEIPKSKKRKGSQGTKRKVKKKGRNFQQDIDKATFEESTSKQKPEQTEEEEKKRVDSLWADFMKDTSSSCPTKSSVTSESKEKDEVTNKKPVPPKKEEKEKKVTVTEIFKFAGEEVSVTKEVAASSAEATAARIEKPTVSGSSLPPGPGKGRGRSSGGLSSVLSQIGKKPKLGTLEKSKLDWDRFKKNEGIEDELRTFNRGKEGYLEKQDFLQRTDLRQFEIEKGLRASKRSNR